MTNDSAHHKWVPVAWQRYAEPNPVNVRSVLWIKDEYVILHDDLHLDPTIPSYWHMQVVADGETGNPHDGYVFRGRFGTDLQVMLPDQKFTEVICKSHVPLEYHIPPEKSFTMRHLQLKADRPDHYLALIRPLSKGKNTLRSRAIRQDGRVRGIQVEGENIDDVIFLSRDSVLIDQQGIRFAGRYGTVGPASRTNSTFSPRWNVHCGGRNPDRKHRSRRFPNRYRQPIRSCRRGHRRCDRYLRVQKPVVRGKWNDYDSVISRHGKKRR